VSTAVIALVYAVFYALQHCQLDEAWNPQALSNNAQSHAGVLGVFAGFIAAVVVIFLQREESDRKHRNDVYRHGAIAVFLSAFLAAILGSFQYASFTGLPECLEKLGTVGSLQASLVFDLISIDYLLAVYLGFYALVVVIKYVTGSSGLARLTYFMLMMIFLLGSGWVFLDFALSTNRSGASFPYALLGLLYTMPVLLATWASTWFEKMHPKRLLRWLYTGVWVSVLAIVLSGMSHAALSAAGSTWAAAHIDTTRNWTIWATAVMLAVLFSVFTFCANILMGFEVDDHAD
jgi:hypothetical protein